MLDKLSGRSRGFAFVEYATPEEAQKAIEQFHDKDFQGRKITVNVARPREERPPRSDRGGFGGERRERY
jgi:RNA recognition motif-containing protein